MFALLAQGGLLLIFLFNRSVELSHHASLGNGSLREKGGTSHGELQKDAAGLVARMQLLVCHAQFLDFLLQIAAASPRRHERLADRQKDGKKKP